VPFAIAAQDARGFTLLRNAPQPPSAVTISGDRLHQLTASAQGAGEFALRYGGLAAGDVTVSAAAPGAAAASASFGSLAVNPASLEIAPGSTIALGASLPGYAGAFTASAGSTRCSVSPASATPAGPGATVQFNVRLASGSGCEVLVRAVKLNVPIVIPVKNAVAHPGLGIGGSKIQHVVVLFQENRSFDNIFGGLDQNGKPFPGADTVSNPDSGEPTPHNHLGNPVTMKTGKLEECYDPNHAHPNSVDGRRLAGQDGRLRRGTGRNRSVFAQTVARADELRLSHDRGIRGRAVLADGRGLRDLGSHVRAVFVGKLRSASVLGLRAVGAHDR
jgi:hypothetical protein